VRASTTYTLTHTHTHKHTHTDTGNQFILRLLLTAIQSAALVLEQWKQDGSVCVTDKM